MSNTPDDINKPTPTPTIKNTLGPVITHLKNNFVSTDHKPVETRIDGNKVKRIGSRSGSRYRNNNRPTRHNIRSEFAELIDNNREHKKTYELIKNCGANKGTVYFTCKVDRSFDGEPLHPKITFQKFKGETQFFKTWCNSVIKRERVITYQIHYGEEHLLKNVIRRQCVDGIRTEIDWRSEQQRNKIQ